MPAARDEGRGETRPAARGWPRAERVRAAVDAPVGSHLLRPDSRVVRRPGWYQVVTPSCPAGFLNEVVHSRSAAGRADAEIDATWRGYAEQGLPCKWCVGPWTEPEDVGERLEARRFSGWSVRGMGADPTTLRPAVPGDVVVERVTAGGVPAFVGVLAEAWGRARPGEGASTSGRREHAALVASHVRAVAGDGWPRHEFYEAVCDGEPAGAAGLVLHRDGSGYLVNAAVLPALRGRGVYRALLATRLARLAALGLHLAITQAREDTSAPILDRLGFETLFRSRCYLQTPDEGG